jgi:hypothetical protein
MITHVRTPLLLAAATATMLAGGVVLPLHAAAFTTPVTQRNGDSQTPGEESLLSHVPAQIRSTCEPNSANVGSDFTEGLVASVVCSPPGGSSPMTVIYVHYVDSSFLDAAFNNTLPQGSKTPEGNCEKGKEGQETYTLDSNSNVTAGKLACTSGTDEKYITWTHNDLRILAQAKSSKLSFPQLLAWWKGPESGPE